LPDIIGALVSFGALLLLLRFWRPAETLGYGGVPLAAGADPAGTRPAGPGPADAPASRQPPGVRAAVPSFVAFGILIVVVVAATGPWSHLGDYTFIKPEVDAVSSLNHQPVAITWKFAPAVA